MLSRIALASPLCWTAPKTTVFARYVEDVSRFAREMKAHVLGIALLRERRCSASSSRGRTKLDRGYRRDDRGHGHHHGCLCTDREKAAGEKAQSRSGSNPCRRGGGSKVERAIVKSIRNSCGQPSGSYTAPQRATFASRYFFKLAEMGYVTGQGTQFSAAQIKRLLEG